LIYIYWITIKLALYHRDRFMKVLSHHVLFCLEDIVNACFNTSSIQVVRAIPHDRKCFLEVHQGAENEI
jgi:hypothetical protein